MVLLAPAFHFRDRWPHLLGPERFAEWRALAAPWVADGSLRYREDIIDGLENAPGALTGILGGQNFGKLLVRVGADPA